MNRVLFILLLTVVAFGVAHAQGGTGRTTASPSPTKAKPNPSSPAQPQTPAVAISNDGHEYAPIAEKTVNYKNWTLNDLGTSKPVSLRSLMQGKKLVMVLYFAPWCPNWRNEAPVAARLYDKYKSQGFEIVAVSEYAPAADTRTYFGPNGAPYPVVVESQAREDRDKTSHYAYRRLTGDTRNWGSPWNIFLDPAKCKPTGDVLTEKAFVVNGELIEAEADKFIADRLKTNAAITPCKP